MATIDGIQVSTQVLTDTAGKVSTLNDQLDGKLADINRQMNDLEQNWKSDAANDIRQNMNALKPRFAEYKAVVDSYVKFLRDTAASYEQTESTIQSNASAFK
jgi:WXG100 family type VII secretion target